MNSSCAENAVKQRNGCDTSGQPVIQLSCHVQYHAPYFTIEALKVIIDFAFFKKPHQMCCCAHHGNLLLCLFLFSSCSEGGIKTKWSGLNCLLWHIFLTWKGSEGHCDEGSDGYRQAAWLLL